MKKRFVALFLCAFLLGLTACGGQQTTPDDDAATPSSPTENGDPTIEFAIPDGLLSCLAQAGLTDPDLFSVSDTATFADGVTGQAYLLLADDTKVEDTFNSFTYLAILYGKTALLQSLDTYALGGEVSAGDLDGDGDCEILTQLVVGASGGAGNYDTRVYDLQREQLSLLYDFDDFDTGYAIELLKDRKYRITNRFTGYSEEFLREGKDDAYFEFWYDEHGVIQENELMVDSFFECELLIPPGGSVGELHIEQYTSLVDHADHIGDAVSVLTYDKESKTFKVTQASFEPK